MAMDRTCTCPFERTGALAYLRRIQLWSDGFYATPGLSWDRDTCRADRSSTSPGAAAVAEVVVDTLTGEPASCVADLLHDVGARSESGHRHRARSKGASSRAWAG